MAKTPVASEQMPSGAIRFEYDDGTTQDAPPTPYTLELNAALPDRMAGATAGLEDVVRDQLENVPPPAHPVATDAYTNSPLAVPASNPSMAAPASTAPSMASAIKAGPISTAAPTSELEAARARSRAGFASGAGGTVDPMVQRELLARQYGMTTMGVAPSATPPTYAPNPNEGQPSAPRPAPVRVTQVPGAWVPKTRQYQYTEVPESAKDNAIAAIDESYEAAETRAEAMDAEAQRQIKQDIATAEALKYEEAQQAKRDAERRARAQQELDRIRREVDEVGSIRINPNAYWDSKSTGEKIGLAIALGITNAAGMPGLQQMINAEIDRNIDTQKSNKMIADKRVSDRVNVYKEMLDRFGDEQAAELAARAVYEKQIARQAELNAKRLEASDPMRAARAQELKAAYLAQLAETEAKLNSRQVVASEAYTPPRTVVTGGGPARGTTVDPNDPTASMSPKDAKAYRELAKSMRDHVGALADLRSAADAVRSTDAGTGVVASRAPSWLLSTEGNRVRGKVTAAIGRYGKATYGAMTADEYNRAKETATGSGTREETLNGLGTLTNGVRASADNELKQYPAHVQEAFRRAHPDLFPPAVEGKAPGQ